MRPREIVAPVELDLNRLLLDGAGERLPVTRVEPWTFEHESARRTLLDQFRTNGLEGFGLDAHPSAVSAAGALLALPARHAEEPTSRTSGAIAYKTSADCLLIDAVTLKHLEIVESMDGGPRRHAAPRARSHGHRRWPAGCCAPGCSGRSSRSTASAIGWTPSRSSPSAAPTAASSARC